MLVNAGWGGCWLVLYAHVLHWRMCLPGYFLTSNSSARVLSASVSLSPVFFPAAHERLCCVWVSGTPDQAAVSAFLLRYNLRVPRYSQIVSALTWMSHAQVRNAPAPWGWLCIIFAHKL